MMQKTNIEHILNEFKKIQNLYKIKKFEKVIEKTFLLLKKDPNQVSFYNYIGLSYRQIGKLDNAEKIFQKGLVLFPDSLSIICNLGSLYRVKLNYDKAESFFQRGLKIKQDDFNTLCNYGNLKRDLNQNQQAIDFYIRALEINNHNQALLINLASAYQIEGDFDSSKKILKTIHLKFPENTKADFMYSSIHNYTENDDHRKKMLDKLKLNNQPQEINHLYFAIAKSYSDVKDYLESANYFI
jgi:tetratricopeptide (TPR) repeat protein